MRNAWTARPAWSGRARSWHACWSSARPRHEERVVTTKDTRLAPEAQPEGYIVMCLVHGSWERALEVMEELGPLPCYAPQLAVTAGRLLQQGDGEGALRVAARAVELDATCAAAQSALGVVLLATGDAAGAEARLRRAV